MKPGDSRESGDFDEKVAGGLESEAEAVNPGGVESRTCKRQQGHSRAHDRLPCRIFC